jgi:type I restriction enzyme, S subunit
MTIALQRVTETGGREATTRHISPKLALAVGMPADPAPKGWRWAALTSLARLESGHTPSRRHPEYWGGSIPWIGIGDAKANDGRRIEDTQEKINELGIENSSARVLPENTVCLSRTASVGYVVVMGRPMATSQDFVNWVCTKELLHDFLKYLFIAEGDGLLRFSSGAVHQTIYFPEVKAFYIRYPPFPEQQRIVGILDEAFEGIASAKANAEKNLQHGRALFESYLSSVFAERGPGWVEKSLDEVGTTQTGMTPKTSERDNYGDFVPFVKPADFHTDGTLDYENDGLSKKGLSGARKVAAGSVLMVCIGATIGKCGYCDRDITTNQQINSLTPLDGMSNKFLYYQMRSDNFQRRVLLNSGQATLPIINKSKWSALRVTFPLKLEDQKRIAAKFEALGEETEGLVNIYKRKLAALEALKKSLLHQAFIGEL